jgi:hypothetical protein
MGPKAWSSARGWARTHARIRGGAPCWYPRCRLGHLGGIPFTVELWRRLIALSPSTPRVLLLTYSLHLRPQSIVMKAGDECDRPACAGSFAARRSYCVPIHR